MGMTFTPSGSDTQYAEIRGNIADNAISIYWAAVRMHKLDDNTIVLAGSMTTGVGVEHYPRDKEPKYPELVFIKLRKDAYEVNSKNSQGEWVKVKREPSKVERCFTVEVLNNWDEWKDKIHDGHINFIDNLDGSGVTPIGKSNRYWMFNPSLHGKVPDWNPPEKKEYGNGNGKYPPKKTPVELYGDVKTILEMEMSSERPLTTIIAEFKAKFGIEDASEFLNTVLLGVLPK